MLPSNDDQNVTMPDHPPSPSFPPSLDWCILPSLPPAPIFPAAPVSQATSNSLLLCSNPIEGRVVRLPPLPDIIEGEERYEVKEVINSQFYYQKLQFLVKWKGYGHKENLWLSERDIDAPDLIMDFYAANPNAPKQISMITFGQMGF